MRAIIEKNTNEYVKEGKAVYEETWRFFGIKFMYVINATTNHDTIGLLEKSNNSVGFNKR